MTTGSSTAAQTVIGTFDLFRVGVGPSSSHTVGPMRAAAHFAAAAVGLGVHRVRIEVFGSLAATGAGHGTFDALLVGLEGADPQTIDPRTDRADQIRRRLQLDLAGSEPIHFDPDVDIVAEIRRHGAHSNAMIFTAADADGLTVRRRSYYSVGGGFVVGDEGPIDGAAPDMPVPHVFASAAELLAAAGERSIADVMWDNEIALRSPAEVRSAILHIRDVMTSCIDAGFDSSGVLPGRLGVARRARALRSRITYAEGDGAGWTDWVSVYAIAVNEENAAGGRVVTAPTNGAAGIIPAVLTYYQRFVPNASDDGTVVFLLTAAAIGGLIKRNASISGAEVGCQGEVGSACAMAAAGLAAVLGGSPAQVENAAEIGLEHNLGLTCDPIGGLVQIPCIERNAIAAVKAVTAARLALHSDGTHRVSLDDAIDTLRRTGADMLDKYKETSLGGLALTVVEC